MNGVATDVRRNKAVLVLGMHRSGTSALTRVLNLLGVELSDTLWPADSANKRGFWEDPRVFGIHDAMLNALGRTWEDLRELPKSWLDSEPANIARDQLVELLRAEFSGSSLWMVKDPRICRLLPLWEQVFEQLNVSPHIVLALRHPDEVAESLRARNAHSLAQTRLAWLEHMAEAVLKTRAYPRVTVSYDQLMDDWGACVRRVAKELALTWPINLASVSSEINNFLSRDERHHQLSSASNDMASDLIDRLYMGLKQAAEGHSWQLADEAAMDYSANKQAFLDAIAFKQEEFEGRQARWLEEQEALREEWSKTLQIQREEWHGDFAARMISSTQDALMQVVLHGEWFEQVVGTIESRIEEKVHAHMLAVAAMHEETNKQLHTSNELIHILANDIRQERGLLRTAIENLQHSQKEAISLGENLQHLKNETAELAESLRRSNNEIAALHSSTSWRVTAPFRFLAITARAPRPFLSRMKFLGGLTKSSLKHHGLSETLRRIVVAPRRHGLRSLLVGSSSPTAFIRTHSQAIEITAALPRALPAQERLSLRVLIIAEMSLQQCLKYRVTQKQQLIMQLGIDCTVISWTDTQKCRDLLQTHSVVIFYRVPGFPEILQIIREAKVLGLATFWEVDDLIFDAEKYAANSNLDDLDEDLRRSVLDGVPLYRAALQECGMGIASTQGLAEAMREAGVLQAFVVENALDAETLLIASKINEQRRPHDAIVRIVYGSGSKAHDADFRVAASAIKRVLLARPNVRFQVIGELNLPADYQDLEDQLERLPTSDYSTYLERLALCDISIAPLEDGAFNDAKSNIKFLEASVARLPSVCSPRAAFRAAIKEGDTGYLPEDDLGWEKALLELIDNADLREQVARRAHDHVTTHYLPSMVAMEQVAPILLRYQHRRAKLRVVGVNIFFTPRSFGGATIVAEEIMRRLNQREDVEYAMFTTLPTSDVPAYQLVRYSSAGGDVFAMGLPHESDPSYEYCNPNSLSAFAETLRAVRPDVVHLHSVQGIGARIAEVCKRENIPYVITLHDAWWICARQFMVTGAGQYCYQRKIDLSVCASCVADENQNKIRQAWLRDILMCASRLVAPSQFFRQLYLDNEFDADQVIVNKNGIVAPKRAIKRESMKGRFVRFGFVGGEGPIKGAPLIRKAFRGLPYKNYELRVVDNELNLGRRTIDPELWAVPGILEIIPAYTQSTIDDFFESIDVLLFPTQWKESFGLSIREALIRDVWVIATDAGGVIEDIVAGENGDIIPIKDDGTELSLAIGRLLENPSRLNRFKNPYADRIRLFDEQADELCTLFIDVARGASGS